MAVITIRGNDALNVNPPAGASHLTRGASDWLWALTAVFVILFLVTFAGSLKAFNNEKIFHYLFTIALFVGAISYFAMASDLGWSVIATDLYRGDAATYQIFFVKYIYWVVSWPIAILALGLISGVSWTTIVFNIFLAWIWVISYLCSAYTATDYKWGFYAFGTVAYFMLAYQTLFNGMRASDRVGTRGHYLALAGYLNFLWFFYPIAFAVADGGNVISVPRSFIFFGILDLLLIPGLAIATIFLSRKWDYGRLNMHFTQYGRVHTGTGTFPEKHHAAAGTTAPANPSVTPAV